jgi:hypothetical protein
VQLEAIDRIRESLNLSFKHGDARQNEIAVLTPIVRISGLVEVQDVQENPQQKRQPDLLA